MKKNILVFIDWYYPAYKAGGPVKSVAGIVLRLAHHANFSIVCSDSDLDGPLPVEVPRNEWTTGPSGERVYYARQLNFSEIKKIIADENPDVVYLNSLFSIKFSLLPLLAAGKRKVILAPRGMLGRDALKLKAFKKSVFLFLFKVLQLHKKVLWHTSTPQEATEVQQAFGKKVQCHSAMDLPPEAELLTAKGKSGDGVLKLVFLSRIAQKKNLHFALQCLGQSNIHAQYDIYGPIDEADYWAQCEKEISKLPSHIRVRHCGTVPGTEVTGVLAGYDFFYMPTLHENYGHAITESFAAGTPVIISRHTPWQDLQSKNVGFDLPLHDHEFASALQQMDRLSNEEYQLMSEACIAYAPEVRGGQAVINDNMSLFA